MTALKKLLLERISTEGPLSLADYMATCLLHPEHGYYATRDPLGTKGDFTTAPEISQMFGEMLGLSLAQNWLDQGAPAPFTLAELGPGRGTLMADILRVGRNLPGFIESARIVLVEMSPTLRTCQEQVLSAHQVTWIGHVGELPDGPLWCVANEFFDALPIRQFQRADNGWCERRVGLRDHALALGLAGETQQEALSHRLDDTKPGDIVELCPALPAIVGEISRRIEEYGGAALFVDYGDWRSLGDTFQALEAHAPADPMANPGLADLTAHVDFEAIARAARCDHSRLTTQGVFLERLGITGRAQALAARMQGAQLDAHIAAHRRLTHPDEMGTLFKVLGLMPRNSAPLPGLET